jgi:hypothetical protein
LRKQATAVGHSAAGKTTGSHNWLSHSGMMAAIYRSMVAVFNSAWIPRLISSHDNTEHMHIRRLCNATRRFQPDC